MVTIGTWTVENLFSAGEFAPAPDVFAQKLEGIVAAIEMAGLDLVALQEVGDDDAFDSLVARLGNGWHGAASTAPDARGIRVAVVSRLPLTDIEHVVDVAPGLTPP